MFEKLRQKWKVSGWQLALIIATFAIGGSATGYLGKKILNGLDIQQDWLWTLIYILLITLLWPLAVLIVSIPLGQFSFFRNYIRKIGAKMGVIKKDSGAETNIAIFASGAGSNARKIIERFRGHERIRVALIVCNKPGAGVLNIAREENIPVLEIQKERFYRGDAYIPELEKFRIGFIVLAGFLWKIPGTLIQKFPRRIVNIHPALLPQYGGKGLYGHFVHEAVLAAHEKESGISIHYVDELYDHGPVIFQERCPVLENDTADSLAARVHELEHAHYPDIIEHCILSLPNTL